MVRYTLVGLAALTCASMLEAQTAETKVETVSAASVIDRTTQTEDVRFRGEGYERMTVPVRLSGTGPYRFLVDTGASRTAISRELAARLKLVAGDDASLHSVAGVSTVSTATVPDLQLTRKAVKVIDAPILERSNMGADGILGVDSLRSQRVTFDFEGQTMSIVPSISPSVRDEPGAIVIQAARRNGRLIVTEATVNGRHVTVVLDTGSQVTIANEALRKQLLRGKRVKPAQLVELQSVTGEKISGEYMFVRELKMGDVGLNNLAIVFADAHTFKQLKLNDRPAILLGMNAIRAFKKVSIDFATLKFRVVLPEPSENNVEVASPRATDWSIARHGR